jgi:hypothetical protein
MVIEITMDLEKLRCYVVRGMDREMIRGLDILLSRKKYWTLSRVNSAALIV